MVNTLSHTPVVLLTCYMISAISKVTNFPALVVSLSYNSSRPGSPVHDGSHPGKQVVKLCLTSYLHAAFICSRQDDRLSEQTSSIISQIPCKTDSFI